MKVEGMHDFREFEGISHNNSQKWVTQMLGCFLYVFQKLATPCLLKTAACSRSDNLVKPDENDALWKSCLEITISGKNVIGLFHLCVPLQGKYMHARTHTHPPTHRRVHTHKVTHNLYKVHSFYNSWMVPNAK